MTVHLHALLGTNPLGLLAALGVLDVLDRAGIAPTLHWTTDFQPHAVLTGYDDLEDVIDELEADRVRWISSPLLTWGGDSAPADLKVSQRELRAWGAALLEAGRRAEQDLFCALLAEGAVAGKGDSKPTHLHFTAGQQRFLLMIRELVRAVRPQHFRQALTGPWTYLPMPTLGWDARGDRGYALRATDPSKEKREGVPGADWLAFLGLAFFPVVNREGTLLTRGCARAWKRSGLRWPLWEVPLTRATVASLLADPHLESQTAEVRRARGITKVLRAPIRRTDQGGYGSFGPATLAPQEPASDYRGHTFNEVRGGGPPRKGLAAPA